MKRRKNYFSFLKKSAIVGAFLLLVSCETINVQSAEEMATIKFSIDDESIGLSKNGEMMSVGDNMVKSASELGDTTDFILRVYSTSGSKVYEGKYGKRPADFNVLPGGYEISLYSREKNKPTFEMPLYGDTLVTFVEAKQQLNVRFRCRQLSGGVKFNFTQEFKDKFPGQGIVVQQGENRVSYYYTEDRYLYLGDDFFSLIYADGYKDTTLLNKRVLGNEMINMNLTYSSSGSGKSAFSISLDTNRVWYNHTHNVSLQIPTGVYTIEEAKRFVGEKNLSIFGYVYGGDPTESSIVVRAPFKSTTTLVLAPSMTERYRYNMMVVELPSGDVRDGANLVAYPRNLGRPVVITGNLVADYYGYIGIKSTKSVTFLD